MDDVNTYIEVDVNPTESEDKVRKAIENIFGNVNIQTRSQRRGCTLVAEAKGTEALVKLYNVLRRERIRDAARKALLGGLSGRTVCFYLNKQVAYVGHVSFSGEVAESPLGPLRVRIECENPRRLINWLTSKTIEG
jgi:predicted RNA binding protein with dsRBD fold (UPF0201 family)